MKNHELWNFIKELKTPAYKWVDLTHELSAQTPHWHGFQPLQSKVLFDFDTAPMKVVEYTFASQYGTHVDVPSHFAGAEGRSAELIGPRELVYPLCVIDKSDAVRENHDYALTIDDVLEWERANGRIPENAFVAFRSDWHLRPLDDFDNKDANGQAHYPGWDLDTVKWLLAHRNIGAIGHETSDTDPAIRQREIGFAAEDYILRQDKIQIELLTNLDQLPPTGAVIFIGFPKIKEGTGFPARCYAVFPE